VRTGKGRLFFEGQVGHLVCTSVLLAGVYAAGRLGWYDDGFFLGLSTAAWVWITVAEAVAHQVYVWLCWRAELHLGLLTRAFGRSAFGIYAAGFTILILTRPVLVIAVAASNQNTIPMDPTPASLLAAVLAVPSVYLFYSVGRYFGFKRAFGFDHFDESYRSAPLVRDGIFRFTPNAMYVAGFLLVWIPGVALRSRAALVVALFSHLYIWVHYFFTEKPDMNRIYRGGG